MEVVQEIGHRFDGWDEIVGDAVARDLDNSFEDLRREKKGK